MRYQLIFSFFWAVLFYCTGYAQKTNRVITEQCGTMQRLQLKFERNPALKARFEKQREIFNRSVLQRSTANDDVQRVSATIYIPVIFHIVLPNPNVVTDVQILSQLDTLNKDFFGINGDSVKIPSHFKSLFGKSGIQFCLAQRTPDEEETSGIDRSATTQSSFGIDDGVKHTSSGGVAGWNTGKYFNVWITALSNGLLGYSTFPDDGSPDEQGVVIDYRSLPGGSAAGYNTGKTLTHETGHYFNLYHIWGDDDGACTGTDYVDDTPNQANSSGTCYSGIHTDNCTTNGNGIMFQNYMDYTPDACLVMFTTDQVTRMEAASTGYRSSLFSSDGCQPVVFKNYDVQLTSIDQPDQRLCNPSFTPVITVKNKGLQTITSLQISVVIDDAVVLNYNWTGSLTHGATTTVTMPSINTTTGTHTLTVEASKPNNSTDEEPENNALSTSFQYYESVMSVSESFESSAFPPPGWDIVNPDKSITWQRITSVAKTGSASVIINNYENEDVGQKDDLRLPDVFIPSTVDSAFLSFQVAAATYTTAGTTNNNWDTLEVLISKDCGLTYTGIYKNWGSSFVTKTAAITDAFVPTSDEWRKDSINLASYIGENNLVIAFRNTSGYENNIYLDDINLRTVSINPNLKRQGFLVTPNPTTGIIAIQFYPQPTNLKSIQIFSIAGQKITEFKAGSGANNYYSFNMSQQATGTYIVRAIFSDKVLTKKIIKN
jgi:hypothetical protein